MAITEVRLEYIITVKLYDLWYKIINIYYNIIELFV